LCCRYLICYNPIYLNGMLNVKIFKAEVPNLSQPAFINIVNSTLKIFWLMLRSYMMNCRCSCAPCRHRSESAVINVVQNHGQLFCIVTNNGTIISQIITFLHFSTLSCHHQGACNQYFAKLVGRYWLLWPTNAQLFHKLSHTYMFRHYRVILTELVTNTLRSYTCIWNILKIL